MALFTIDQLLTPTTADAVKAQMYAYLASTGLPVTSWQAFSPTRVLVDVFSRLLATAINLVVTVIRAGFRDSAEGDALAVLSDQMYGVELIPATFAVGTDCLVINNSGGGIYDFNPGELTVKNSVTGKTYHNTNVIHVGALQTGVVASLSADEIGAASNAAPGEITQIVTTALGLTCTNVSPVQGSDRETDDALRARDLDKLSSLSPDGAAGAYAYVAKTPTLNGGVAVNRVRRLPPPGDGTVTIVVAGPLGPLSSGDVALIQTGIDTWATPVTVTATVVSAVAAPQTYSVQTWVPLRSGLSAVDVQAMVRTALVNYINNEIPIGGLDVTPGGIIPWRSVAAAAKASTPDGETHPIEAVKLGSEVDVVLATNAVATLDAGSVTVTTTFTRD